MNTVITSKYLIVVCIVGLLLMVVLTIQYRPTRTDSSTRTASHVTINTKQDAIQFLKQKLQGHKKTTYWLTSDCVAYWTESNTVEWVIQLHELHNEDCEGDPNTMPLLAQFTINKKTHAITWYDVMNDQYKSLNEFLLMGD